MMQRLAQNVFRLFWCKGKNHFLQIFGITVRNTKTVSKIFFSVKARIVKIGFCSYFYAPDPVKGEYNRIFGTGGITGNIPPVPVLLQQVRAVNVLFTSLSK